MSVEYPDITPEMLKEFEDSLSPKLRVPTVGVRTRTFTVKKGKPEEAVVTQKNWRESARVDSIVVAANTTEGWGNHTLFKIKFNITDTKGSGLNVKRTVTLSVRYKTTDILDWQKRQIDQGQLLLTQLVRAAGYDVVGGLRGDAMRAFFPTSGESPLVNTEVEIDVASKSNSDFDEVANIFKLVVAAADAEV